jgi:plastocyanin
MQRRAATVYAVFFLVIAAGSYSLIGVAQEPGIDLEGDTYAENDTMTVNDMDYTVASVGDGEGTLSRVNESARYTTMWANNSTVQWDNSTYRVLIPNESDPGQFTLRQEFNLSENTTTVTQNETEYVVVDENGNKSLVPVDEYKNQQFGEPETREYAEGDTFQFEGNETIVSNVTAEEATLAWNAPRTLETSLAEGGNVTLGPDGNNETFVAHFPEDGVVQLSSNPDEYQTQANEIDHFNERIAGLWGIAILSGLTVALLFGLALLPNK